MLLVGSNLTWALGRILVAKSAIGRVRVTAIAAAG
jgi:hypothetical protein